MGMSSHVYGFRPPDAIWAAKKDAWDACVAADIPMPVELQKFFQYETPDPKGVNVDIKDAISEYSEEMGSGFEVDLTKLPKNVTIIRFVNSY